MSAPLRLFLDLGDAFTKALVVGNGRRRRLRFPSVVATRLLNGRADAADLLLDGEQSMLRPRDFEPRDYPRSRSYPGGAEFLSAVRTGGHHVAGARFAGWLAAAHGADRQLLGSHPTPDNVDALVRKALLMSAADSRSIEIVFVVDVGAKAGAVGRYAETAPRATAIDLWSFLRAERQRIEVSVRTRLLDAAVCALAKVPAAVDLAAVGRLLLIDIGYLRTKLAFLSAEGCEHQELLAGLGVSDCVRRILRDEQEQGLVEDEFAVIRALEQSQDVIEIAGRSFDIRGALDDARCALAEELAHAVRRIVLEQYNRRGEMCRAAAVIGGGAAVVGRALATGLASSELRLEPAWVTTDTCFLLVEGAHRTLQGVG